MYDDMKPSNMELTVDPNQASLDFNMNYDIDNPKNILHVNARFSDEQGIKAELFRDHNGVKIVDSLLNLRLKTSKILHTHVQWHPSILRDLKDALSSRVEKYSIETRQAVDEAIEDINREIVNKQRLLRATFNEKVRPFSETITEKLNDLRQMRTDNDYYIRDIHNAVERVIRHYIDLAYDINESWNRCPLKQQIDRPIEGLKHLQQLLEEYSNNVYIGMGDHMTNVGSNSYQSLLDSINSVRNHRAVTSLESKYQSYMSKLQNLQISNIANQYTATIYNVRENINNKLTNYLPTQVYNMGSSAYTSWEVEENIKVVVERIIEEIKKDFSKEMSGIEDVLKNVLKSKVIVYDLARGEIEVDFYLPVDVRTLSSISEISLRKYIPDMTHMIPDTTMLGSLEDYMPHMSLTGHAKIEGEQFTTFDGQKFDFSGRCSYILARDFQDGNFSIILNYKGRQNKKLIITSHQQNVQLAPKGKVRVDGVIMDLPYKSSEFAVFTDADRVIVEGHGFQVKADKNVNNVDIDLSGWYFGKTGGLLGTLNHERYDDMIMPNKQITNDAFTLGSAWQVQERCR